MHEPVSFLILPFLPGALGMAVARLLGFAALGCLYAGRIANLIVYTLLCWLALRSAQKFRPAFLCVMLLPMSLWMGASLSYDAALLACYYLMLALLTRRTWTTRTGRHLCGGLYLGQCGKALYQSAVASAAADPFAGGLLCQGTPLAVDGRHAGGLPGRDPPARNLRCRVPLQLRLDRPHGRQRRATNGPAGSLLLKNPLRYLRFYGTLYENDFFVGQLGLFGWKDLPIAFLSLTGPVALLAGTVLSAGKGQSITRRRTVPLAVFGLVYAVGAMTAMHITYTPVTMVRIVGLQTRYFLPVILVAMTLLAAPLRRMLSAELSAQKAERWAAGCLRRMLPSGRCFCSSITLSGLNLHHPGARACSILICLCIERREGSP